MIKFEAIVQTLQMLKEQGTPRDQALGAIDLDSDERADYAMFEEALVKVYGKQEEV